MTIAALIKLYRNAAGIRVRSAATNRGHGRTTKGASK